MKSSKLISPSLLSRFNRISVCPLSTASSSSSSAPVIIRDLPKCPNLPSHGRPSPQSFQARCRFLEKQLNDLRREFSKKYQINYDGPRTISSDSTKGFYLLNYPYFLPVKRQPTMSVFRSTWARFKLTREQYGLLFNSGVQAAPATFVKLMRHMQDEEWQDIEQADIMDSSLVQLLAEKWSSLTDGQKKLLNIHRRDLISVPGLHTYILPQHKWPHAWMSAMRYSSINGNPCIEMDYLIEAAYNHSVLKEQWPNPDLQSYGFELPRFVIGNLVMSRQLYANPDEWNDWKVTGFNVIVMP